MLCIIIIKDLAKHCRMTAGHVNIPEVLHANYPVEFDFGDDYVGM